MCEHTTHLFKSTRTHHYDKFYYSYNPTESTSSDPPPSPKFIILGTQFPHEKILSPLTCTVDNYDPLPQSIFIPENLRPFIPTTPVYTAPSEGSKYLAPGSPGWFKYLYDQERKTEYRRQRDIQEQESKRKKLEAEKQHKARVAYYSTSVNKFDPHSPTSAMIYINK
ncbi:unnamed protein product [Rhizophagus irregularis]|nr:unnamed protein product [Rhizophagus irregularis]